MAEHPAIRIFISSPSDVRPERLKAEAITARLNNEFAYHFDVQPVLWEREPLVASHHFQDEGNIPQPHRADIVVVILWTRLGVLLPEDQFHGALSGRPVTGTEWEFEDALASARLHGTPDLLLYRKNAPPTATLTDRQQLQERLSQLDKLEEFVGRWFRSDDGQSFTAASHSFDTVTDFEEKLYEHLRALLERRTGTTPAGVQIRWHGPPFRGLAPFDQASSGVFFGRTRARNELRELLARREVRSSAFVLVLGASGSGKSSLVKAGLLPDLMLPGMIGKVALVRHAAIRPSDRPTDLLGDLAGALLGPTSLPELANLRYTPDRLADLLRRAPEQVALPVEQGLAEASRSARLPAMAEARLLLIIDQLEEIFTVESLDPAERDRFVAALDALSRTGSVWVVATMRSDFFDRLELVPALARLAENEACYRLLPPDAAELAQIIRLPAREAGLRFAVDPRRGVGLDEVVLEAAARERGTLPLLSFLLDQLWRFRSSRGELTFESYVDLGGLEGALGRHAETIFSAQPHALQNALPAVLRALVTVGAGPGGAVAARTARLDRFAEGSAARALLEAFLHPSARLLTADDAEGSERSPRVRVAHEALLTHWSRARDWIADRPIDLALEDRIEAEASRWAGAAEGDRVSLLRPAGLPLSEAQDLLARRRDELTEGAIAFVDASIAADLARQVADRRRIEAEEQLRSEAAEADAARHREAAAAARERETAARQIVTRTRIGLAVACVLALVAAGLAWLSVERTRDAEAATSRARVATATAENRLADARLNESRFMTEHAAQELRAGHPELAALMARAALPDDLARPDRLLWYPAASLIAEARAADRALAVLPHKAFVGTVAVSPDGSLVATASQDRTAGIWDASTGLELHVLSGHTGWLTGAAFSPDGTLLVTSSLDKTARIWDARSGAALLVLAGHASTVNQAVFSPDGRQIATSSTDGTARLWDAVSGKLLAALQGHTDVVNRVAWSPDGRRLATASNDGTVRVWDTASGKQQLVLTCGAWVNSVAWSPDGESILTASNDSFARLWNATTGEVRETFAGHTNWVNSAVFSPDGRVVATASQDTTARLWDAASGKLLHVLDHHKGNIIAIAFSTDGQDLVTASADATARLWAVGTGAERAAFLGHDKAVFDAAITPDRSHVVTASADGTGRIWNAGPIVASVALVGHGARVRAVAWSPDGRRLATASDDHTVRIWDASGGAALATCVGHSDEIDAVEWSPDGKRVVSASKDKSARVWDASTGAQLLVLTGHTSFVSSARYSPDGSRILTGSYDATIRLWDAASGAQTGSIATGLTIVLDARWSPDGTRIASADANDDSRIWSSATGAVLATLKGHAAAVEIVAWSPDGARLATGSLNGVTRVWDTETGAEVRQFGSPNMAASVLEVAWSPDGGRLVASSLDRTSRVWDVATGAPAFSLVGTRAVFSPDGRRIATADPDQGVRLSDAATGAELSVSDRQPNGISALAWSPDGKHLATASFDPTARIWPVWSLLTDDTVAYHDVSVLRYLSGAERASLFLRDPSAAAPRVPTVADPAELCDRLAGDPDDSRQRDSGVDLAAIDTVRAGDTCRRAVAAAPNDAKLRYELGRVLLQGGDAAGAAAAFQTAMDGGSAPAASALGDCYASGTGVLADPAKALDLYRQADASGFAPAASRIANLYWAGSAAVPQNWSEALRWFESGATAGDAGADLALGWIYQEGLGAERRYDRALGYDLEALASFRKRSVPAPVPLIYAIGTLARDLDPATAVEIAREAGFFKQAENGPPSSRRAK